MESRKLTQNEIDDTLVEFSGILGENDVFFLENPELFARVYDAVKELLQVLEIDSSLTDHKQIIKTCLKVTLEFISGNVPETIEEPAPIIQISSLIPAETELSVDSLKI